MNGSTTSSQQADPQQHELLRVCRIGRAQGLKGEFNVYAFTDEPKRRFAAGASLVAQAATAGGTGNIDTSNFANTTRTTHTSNSDAVPVQYTVQSARFQKNRWVLKLRGVDDRTAAEALNGTDLYVQADDAEEMAEENAWYPKDLIGLTAVLDDQNELGGPAGQAVGTVVDVTDTGAQWLLKIRLSNPPADAEPTALVPFVDAIVPTVDLDAGTLTLNPPGGLIPGL